MQLTIWSCSLCNHSYLKEIKLYVGNLSWGTDDATLRELFEEYGKVIDCYCPVDRETGQHRGFAFVTMDPDDALRASDETDGYELDGRILRVNEAKPKGYGPSYGDNEGYDGGDAYDEQTDDSVKKALIRFGNIFKVGYRKYFHEQEIEPNFELYGPGFLDERDAKDVAASNQFVFEQRFYKEVKPFLDTYQDYPVILTGGCALNILNNTSIARKREQIFIPPNPNDSGIALGCLFSEISPFDPVDATYLGPDVWDKMELSKYLIQYPDSYHCSIDSIGQKLLNGHIIGVVRGRSELGPRALGNRSLLSCAHFPTSKEYVNSKVKHREVFRPLSPIVRLEDVDRYFEWETESRHMTFSPKVREEYKELLYAITHVDGTARVQTVTRDQNEFIYDLLSYIDNNYEVAVLMNTSFNVAGKPILNTYKEAFEVLETKPINGILIENHFFPSRIIDSNASPYYNYPYGRVD